MSFSHTVKFHLDWGGSKLQEISVFDQYKIKSEVNLLARLPRTCKRQIQASILKDQEITAA